MTPFRVQILAADHPFYEGACYALTLPTSNGMYGVLAHHSNMITAIVPGTLRYQVQEGVTLEAAVSGGLAKVENGEVLILVDTAERPEEIDVRRPAGMRTPPGRPCCKRKALWSIRRPRPHWPGQSAACGSSGTTIICEWDRRRVFPVCRETDGRALENARPSVLLVGENCPALRRGLLKNGRPPGRNGRAVFTIRIQEARRRRAVGSVSSTTPRDRRTMPSLWK